MMKREVQHYLELLERRLETLRLLATDLDESRAAYVTLDLRSMHQHISRQENLCTEIRMLDGELQSMKENLRGLAAAGEMPSTLVNWRRSLILCRHASFMCFWADSKPFRPTCTD